MTHTEIHIGDRQIGESHPCYIIAEIGVNHNGDMNVARELIHAAAEAGADAVKFQSFRAEKVVDTTVAKAAYQQDTTGTGSQFDMLKSLELSYDQHVELLQECETANIDFLSTPYDMESVDLLDDLGVSAFKIGSGDLTHMALLRHAAKTGKPLLVSTGAAYLGEVEVAIRSIYQFSEVEIALLHCVSRYPADPKDANLRAMDTLRHAFRCPVGFSDHSQGSTLAIAAVAREAAIIEKHFTLDYSFPGPDHKASMEPGPFAEMVAAIRMVQKAMGSGKKIPVPAENENREFGRRRLVAIKDLAEGDVVREKDYTALRSSSGIFIEHANHVIGRKLNRHISCGSPIRTEDLI